MDGVGGAGSVGSGDDKDRLGRAGSVGGREFPEADGLVGFSESPAIAPSHELHNRIVCGHRFEAFAVLLPVAELAPCRIVRQTEIEIADQKYPLRVDPIRLVFEDARGVAARFGVLAEFGGGVGDEGFVLNEGVGIRDVEEAAESDGPGDRQNGAKADDAFLLARLKNHRKRVRGSGGEDCQQGDQREPEAGADDKQPDAGGKGEAGERQIRLPRMCWNASHSAQVAPPSSER